MTDTRRSTVASITRSALYGFSTWLFPIVVSFVVTPIIIRSLGNEDYGIYVLVLSFVGYSFNLSFVRAITKELASAENRDDPEKINSIVSAALSLNLPIGIIGALAVSLSANWLVTDVLLVPESQREQAVTAIYLAAAIMVVTQLVQFVDAILQGRQRFDVFSRIFNLKSAFLLIGNAVIAYLGFDLEYLLIWNLVLLILIFGVGFYTCKMIIPGLRLRLGFNNPALKSIVIFSLGLIGYQVLSNAMILFERGWLMRKFGAVDVTFYVVPLALAIYIHSFIGSLMMFSFPLTSELRDQTDRLIRMYEKSVKLSVFLVFFILASVVANGEAFLTAWLGSDFADSSTTLLLIHATTYSIVAIQVVSWHLMEGLGRSGYNFGIYVVCVAIGVSLMVLLTPDYGLEGVAIGRLAGFATIFASVFVVEAIVFRKVLAGFWFKTLFSFGVSAVAAGFIQSAVAGYFAGGWLAFFVSVGIGFAVFVALSVLLRGIGRDERELFRRIFSGAG